MSITTLIPSLALVMFGVFTLSVLLRLGASRTAIGWQMPALFSGIFLLFSVYTIEAEGLLGFWSEHTESFWGNQVWCDLLLAISIGWYLIVPRARAMKMNLWLWLGAIASTGCIGFLAMLARLWFLESRNDGVSAAQSLSANQTEKPVEMMTQPTR